MQPTPFSYTVVKRAERFIARPLLSRPFLKKPMALSALALVGCMMATPALANTTQLSISEEISALENGSVKNVLAHTESLLARPALTPIQRLNVQLHQARGYRQQGDLLRCYEILQHVAERAEAIGAPHLFAKARKDQGVYLYLEGKFFQAIGSYQDALKVYQALGEELAVANLYNNIGLSYFDGGDLKQALDYYHMAEPIYQQVGSTQDNADILFNIAGIYLKQTRYDTALDMYRAAMVFFEKTKDFNGIAQAHGNIAIIYRKQQNYPLAEQENIKAIQYFKQQQNLYMLSVTQTNLANVYADMNNLEGAALYAQYALENALSIQNEYAESSALHTLAHVHFYRGEHSEAISLVERSITLARKLNAKGKERDGLGKLSLILAANGEMQKAVETHKAYQALIEKLHDDEIGTSLNAFQAKFEATQLQQQVEKLKQARKLQDLEMASERQQTVLIGLGALVLFLTGFLIYRRRVEQATQLKLEAEVKERTLELETMANELSQANQVKSQFLANMSHEIRTPLTAIIGLSEAILRGDIAAEEVDSELNVIHNNSLHLLNLINDILDLSKIEANKLELDEKPCDLHHLLKDVENMFRNQAESKGLTFNLEVNLVEPYPVKIDDFRLKQILINLVSNAVKFTEQGVVSIQVGLRPNGIAFSVRDTGIGMNKAQLKDIFEHFSQGDNTISRRFGGSGLGLCLSQQLAIKMGGYIQVISEPEQGSEFTLQLPCPQVCASELALSKAESPRKAAQNKLSGTVLIAEDHPDNRRLIVRLLEGLGLTVIAVDNGKDAIEMCLSAHPDLVLLDIQMPQMDGVEALTLLRQCGVDVPIYALTANAMSHEVDAYLEQGFSGHLLKPIERDAFYNVLCRYLPEQGTVDPYLGIDLTELKLSFEASLPNESDALKLAYSKEDHETLQGLAHRLAGAAKTFSYHRIAEQATGLELALKLGQAAAVDRHYLELIKQISMTLANPLSDTA